MCEDCGEEPCSCEERLAAELALYGDEYCAVCGIMLDGKRRCPSCDWWAGLPGYEEPSEDEDDDA